MTYKFFLDILRTKFDYVSQPISNELINCSEKLQNYWIDVADVRKNRKYYGRISLFIRKTQEHNSEEEILSVNLIKPYDINCKFLCKIDYLKWRMSVDEDTLRPPCKEFVEAMRPASPRNLGGND